MSFPPDKTDFENAAIMRDKITALTQTLNRGIRQNMPYTQNLQWDKKVSDLENGYYEQSEKLIKMVMTVITCIGTVMIPRNTKEFYVIIIV